MMNVYKINDADDREKEHQLLSFLHQNEMTSQRKMASGTGLSLATVNILLKRMIKRGLVKIEHLNQRNLRYILTPNGLAEKSRLTYHYVIYSYRLINRLINIVQNCIAEERTGAGLREVTLLGKDDYIHELLSQALARENVPFRYCPDIDSLPADLEQVLILTWDSEIEQELQGPPCRVVNVMLYL
jgi:DNA-binding MarR family transcriptional regulator